MVHVRWQGIKRIPNQHLNSIQLAYVRGYILALEDVIKDIDSLSRVHDRGCDEFYGALAMIKDKITETLESANRTITVLERMDVDDG